MQRSLFNAARILGIVLSMSASFSGCDIKEDTTKAVPASKEDRFSIYGDQAGKQVILLNSRTGKTWRLQGNKWMRLSMAVDPNSFAQMVKEQEARLAAWKTLDSKYFGVLIDETMGKSKTKTPLVKLIDSEGIEHKVLLEDVKAAKAIDPEAITVE